MSSRTPRPVQDYRLETVDNEVLLYHPVKTTTLYLNETAALVWRLCDGHRSSEEIVELLSEAFPDAGDSLADEVNTTLDELAKQGAIVFVEA